MTDVRVDHAALEVAVTTVPPLRVDHIGLEVAVGPGNVGPTLRVQIAWNPAITGPARWTQAEADVTPRLLACSVQRSAGLPTIDADEVRLRLDNNDLRYTAANAGGPLYGKLTLDPADGRPVRVLGLWRGTVTPLFYGYLTERTQPLSPHPMGRVVDYVARSPLRLAPQNAQLPEVRSAAPNPPAGDPQRSNILDNVIRLADQALAAGPLGRPELNYPPYFTAPAGGTTALDADATTMEVFGPFSNVVSNLQGLSLGTGGMYYVRPLLEEETGWPYAFVWQALAATEHAPNDWTLDETTTVGEALTFRERAAGAAQMPGVVQENQFLPLTDNPAAPETCHTNTYAPILDGGVILGYSGLLYGTSANAATVIQFQAMGLPIVAPYTPLPTSTIEVWTDAPSAPGAVQLYAGVWDGIPPALGVRLALGTWRSATFVELAWIGDATLTTGAVLTNWRLCWATSNFVPPPPPPVPPLAYNRVDASRYTLELRRTIDRMTLGNPFTRGLGDRVGVTNTELAWTDVPTLVDRVGWAWTASDAPLGESLVATARLAGMPRTRSDGTVTGFVLDGGAGLDFGALA